MKRRDFHRLTALSALGALTGCSRPMQGSHDSTFSPSVARGTAGPVVHRDKNEWMKDHPPKPEHRVTRSNYHEPERLVWFHQHVRELFPTQRVAQGGSPVTLWPRADRSMDGITVPAGERGTPEEAKLIPLLTFLQATDTDAFVVVRDGKIIIEHYFAGMQPQTLHYLWSMSKSISVGVVANLIASGDIDPSELITEYVPELKDTAYEGATVQHLMDMTSAVEYSMSLDLPWGGSEMRTADSAQSRNHRAQGYFPLVDGERPDGTYGFMETLTETAPRDHGEVMYYKDPDIFALAWACERVTGQRFADLLSEHVWSKLGAEHDASIQCDPVGGPIVGSGISATAPDIARWGQMHLQGGQWHDRQVIPARFIADIQTYKNHSRITEDGHLKKSWLPAGTVYRNQFWRFPATGEEVETEFAASGMYGQTCYIHPQSQTVIVKFSSHTAGGLDRVRWELRVFGHLVNSLGD